MSDCANGGRRAYNAPTHTPDEDALTITAHFKDGSERPCTMNRMGRTLDYLESDGERYERVVRCRDCKHHHKGMCMLSDGMGDFKRWLVDDDDYCSDGEMAVVE